MKKLFQHLKNVVQSILTMLLFTRAFKHINPQSVVIDCGANVGDISLKLAKKGARVYAFEPNPYAFDVLSERLKKFDKVTCINKGVWDKNVKTSLFFHKNSKQDRVFWSFGSSILRDKVNIDSYDSVDVELIDLTEFIDQLDTEIDLLKIDIEGAECEVLQKLIEQEQYNKIKLIVVETHDQKIAGQKEKTDKIREMIKHQNIKNIKLSWL